MAGATIAAASVLTAPYAAQAATVVATLSDIDGPTNQPGSPFPIDLGAYGPFSYSIPNGATVTTAFIGGTFGDANYPAGTAGYDIAVDGAEVTGCVPYASYCWYDGNPLRPFSFLLPSSIYGDLLSGSATLEIFQTNEYTVRYGTPTLTINYSVPEPAAWALMLVGFGGVGFALRSRGRAAIARA